MDPFFTFILFLVIVLFSVVIHEVSHGAVANALGDPTARLLGRLTLNPLPHIDLVGTIIVPLLLAIPNLFGIATPVFGWAKPVPYNPLNLKYKRWGAALVGVAGPGSNLLLATMFGLTLRFAPATLPQGAAIAFAAIVFINLLLALFNLMPIPPLDGSKLLFSVFPDIPRSVRAFLEQNGFIILLLFIFFLFPLFFPVITWAFRLLTGLSAGIFL